MNKKLLIIILIIILVGAIACVTLSKKQFSTNRQQTESFQNLQTGNSNTEPSTDAQTLTDIAHSYLQENNQQIYLYTVQKDGTIALDTGVPILPQNKTILDLKIDWKWFVNHNPDYVIDAWQPPYPPSITNYRPDNRYVVQWEYNKYTVTVKIDKNLNAQSTEISPINR